VLADDAAKFKDQGVRSLDAVLSDDGQRSLRYTPFFANSGFFYLHSNPEVTQYYFYDFIAYSLPFFRALVSNTIPTLPSPVSPSSLTSHLLSPQVINFAYSIMTAFPMIQRLGSQQNMFTMRLLESMTNFGMRSFFVNIQDFPNGYLYHHDKPYMKKFLKHEMPEVSAATTVTTTTPT